MNNTLYNIKSNKALILGYQYDHNATRVKFNGFEPIAGGAIYLNIENLGLYPLFDMSFDVSQVFTTNAGDVYAQLFEITSDNSVVQHSKTFIMTVLPSIEKEDEIVETNPDLDLWFTGMSDLYLDVKTKLDNGEFIGERGFSPTVDTRKADGVTTIYFKDLDKISTATVIDGYVPVKGEDYFTEEEITSFKEAVTPIKGIDYVDGTDATVTQENIERALGGTVAMMTDLHAPYNDSEIRRMIDDKADIALVDTKADKLEIPTKMSQLDNDCNYVMRDEIESDWRRIDLDITESVNYASVTLEGNVSEIRIQGNVSKGSDTSRFFWICPTDTTGNNEIALARPGSFTTARNVKFFTQAIINNHAYSWTVYGINTFSGWRGLDFTNIFNDTKTLYFSWGGTEKILAGSTITIWYR